MFKIELELEQNFELVKLKQAVSNLTTQEVIELLVDTLKSSMMTTNQFRNIDKLTLSQQFEVHRMHQSQLSREEAISLLIEAKRQLMIKQKVLLGFKKEIGLT